MKTTIKSRNRIWKLKLLSRQTKAVVHGKITFYQGLGRWFGGFGDLGIFFPLEFLKLSWFKENTEQIVQTSSENKILY